MTAKVSFICMGKEGNMLESFIAVYVIIAAVVFLFRVVKTTDDRKKEISAGRYVGWVVGFVHCLAWPLWLINATKGF